MHMRCSYQSANVSSANSGWSWTSRLTVSTAALWVRASVAMDASFPFLSNITVYHTRAMIVKVEDGNTIRRTTKGLFILPFYSLMSRPTGLTQRDCIPPLEQRKYSVRWSVSCVRNGRSRWAIALLRIIARGRNRKVPGEGSKKRIGPRQQVSHTTSYS